MGLVLVYAEIVGRTLVDGGGTSDTIPTFLSGSSKMDLKCNAFDLEV